MEGQRESKREKESCRGHTLRGGDEGERREPAGTKE